MKYEKKELKDHRVEVSVELEKKRFKEEMQIAARKISKESKIPGFRPGKAPYEVVERIYGEELIEERAIENAINKLYPELLKEAEIKPYGPGKLEEIISKDPPKFRFSIPLQPTIDLGAYSSVRHPYKLPIIKNKDIQKAIEGIRLNYSTAEEVKRKSEKGDLVSVKIDALLQKPEEGQDAQILKNTPHQIIVGLTSEEDNFPFPGFSEKIIGLEAGETIEFIYKYPKDSNFENLKNKEVNFSVAIENVKKIIKPELDDEFAKTVGVKTYDEFANSVREQLETAKKNEYDNQYYDELLEKIINKAKIEYPSEMIDDEITDVLKNFEQELAGRDMDLDTYLKLNTKDKNEFIKKDIKPAAKKRLEHALVIDEISRLEKIELEQSELQKEYTRSFLQIRSDPNYKQLQKEFTTKKLSDALVVQAATRLMNQRTLERIKAIANNMGKEESLTKKEEQIKPLENSNKNLMVEK